MAISNFPVDALSSLNHLLSQPEWLVDQNTFDINQLNFHETLFTTGNGYLGTRGVLEEGHNASLPGTFINGLFDHHDSAVVDLVNAPDWTPLAVWVDGQKLDLHVCKILEFRRCLDMKQGLLYRTTRFQDAQGRVTRFESVRLAHFGKRHLCGIRFSVTAENYSGTIKIKSWVDGHVFNLDRLPIYKEETDFHPEVRWKKWASSKHLQQVESEIWQEGAFLKMKTLDRPHHLAYGSILRLEDDTARISSFSEYERIGQETQMELDQGETILGEKWVAIYTSREIEADQIKNACRALLDESRNQSFREIFESHKVAWNHKWEECDVIIDGDDKINNALRFNIYHLLITANEEDPKANIGAKSLSGEGYKGHVFWDTEIYALPFYIYTQPKMARALVEYRYHTLGGARDYAAQEGNIGARFAWESADTGQEETPKWSPDGIERIWTGDEELHITADVVFGLLSYYIATQDLDFMLDYGLEILFDTARFWANRMELNAEKDRYELTHTMGTDEYHAHVNNSVFNNWMAKWNLEKAVQFWNWTKDKHPKEFDRVRKKLSLDESVVTQWQSVAEKTYLPFSQDTGLIEQFEGYFNLEDTPVSQWDQNNMPIFPTGLDHAAAQQTTLIKQADIIMLLYILPDEFSDDMKKANYQYYEPRTMHKSSLSPSVHTIMAVETNNPQKALQYFERSAYTDLVDNQGNTEWGIHLASAGGTWQALVNGFGGLRVRNQKVTFKPWIPDEWNSIQFQINWRGGKLKVKIEKERAKFLWENPTNEDLVIEVQNKELNLPSDREVTTNLIQQL